MAEPPSIRSRLARRFDPVELRAIKRLWVRHSIAEDARDIDGLSRRSRPTARTRSSRRASAGTGHDGARAFYTELFAAFPDNRFALTDIVVGPQGVFEAAQLTGTNLGPWAGVPASGLPVSLQVLILFPWDPATGRFAGERIWFDRGAVAGPVTGPYRRTARGWRREPRPADSACPLRRGARRRARAANPPPRRRRRSAPARPPPATPRARRSRRRLRARSAPPPSPDHPLPVVVDTDLAGDDLFALLVLLRDPAVDVRGVTIAATGEVHCVPGIRNTRRVLAALRPDRGAGRLRPREPGPERPLVPARVARRRGRVLRRGAAGRRAARPRATRPRPSSSSGSRRPATRRSRC